MVQGKGFTPKELPSTCLSYPTRPSVHLPTRELASAARSYPSSGKTSIEKGGKEYELPAHHQSFLISWLFAKSSVPTRHTRTRPEVCCQDRRPNSPPRSAP